MHCWKRHSFASRELRHGLEVGELLMLLLLLLLLLLIHGLELCHACIYIYI